MNLARESITFSTTIFIVSNTGNDVLSHLGRRRPGQSNVIPEYVSNRRHLRPQVLTVAKT